MQKMDIVLKKVSDYVKKNHMIMAGDTIVAGISGGADSVCLFFLLLEIRKEIPFHLAVVHVNHKIRKEADEDANYVEALCKQSNIPFYLYEIDVKQVAKEEKLSEEEAGRKERYKVFEEVLLKEAAYTPVGFYGKIAVAHNKNDRAETMLFQLFRGSGIKGLVGIRPVRKNIIRPVLCLTREEIEGYLQEKKISYCIDCTNEEDTYTRNKIRHHILLQAQNEICEKAVEHMSTTADILLEAEDYLEEEAEKAFQKCVNDDIEYLTIDCKEFQKIHPYLQKQVVFQIIQSLAFSRKDITAVHIKDIIILIQEKGNKELYLPYQIRVKKQYDQVYFFQNNSVDLKKQWDDQVVYKVDVSPQKKEKKIEVKGLGILEFTLIQQIEKEFQAPQENQYTKWFDYDKIKQSLELRTRKSKDFLTINNDNNHQTLKKYMIQEKIPVQKRDQLLLLADGSHILWVIGHRISAEYKVDKDTKNILKVQFRGGI